MLQPANLKSVERVEARREVWRDFADEIGGGEWFTVRRSADGDVAHVSIFGEVNFGAHWERLLSEIGDARDVRLIVSSRGGDSLLGLAFFHAFQSCVSETRIVGVAGSAAFTMALAGRRILIERGAKILLHAPCSFGYGEATELLCLSRSLRKLTSELAAVLILRTEQPEEVVNGWLNGADFYFTAEQACAYGLADEIFDAPKRDADGVPVGILASDAAKSVKALPTLTEDELFFNDVLLSVGRLKVRSKADFMRELHYWAAFNTNEEPQSL